jgi:hypothetical protein
LSNQKRDSVADDRYQLAAYVSALGESEMRMDGFLMGTGSSITSMIAVSTGTSATCLGAFLAPVCGGRFFLAGGFVALIPARRTLDFAVFGAARFAALLRAATRFFALVMAISCEVCLRQANLDASELLTLSPSDSL